jgi:hypothetical protein
MYMLPVYLAQNRDIICVLYCEKVMYIVIFFMRCSAKLLFCKNYINLML